MRSSFSQQLRKASADWWRDRSRAKGAASAALLLFRNLWNFVRESTPERRRSLYGDMEYDWEHRVNTTSGAVGWRMRLLGLFHSPYQPTDPALFREMMASLPMAFEEFTFVDLGSGKGRTLLMASDYPFRKIIGVEILPELHYVAEENLALYQSESQKCFALQAICGDAAEFTFPNETLVLYLFNPVPESVLRRVIGNPEENRRAQAHPLYILYHNPVLEYVLSQARGFSKIGGTELYSLYAWDRSV